MVKYTYALNEGLKGVWTTEFIDKWPIEKLRTVIEATIVDHDSAFGVFPADQALHKCHVLPGDHNEWPSFFCTFSSDETMNKDILTSGHHRHSFYNFIRRAWMTTLSLTVENEARKVFSELSHCQHVHLVLYRRVGRQYLADDGVGSTSRLQKLQLLLTHRLSRHQKSSRTNL